MRRIRRDTAGGGEIAMMAVITKAMGAFLVLMIILLPYYTSDPIAQRTADETTEQVEKAKEQLQQTQAALKKGRLTDEEIDELQKQLDEAIHQLEEALINIRQLKLQVDHLTAQVKRLEDDVAALQVETTAQALEIKDLKEEIERLKRNQQPEQSYWNMVRLEWSTCDGARLNLYAMRSVADTEGKFSPPPDRTAQRGHFVHDKVYEEVSQYLTEGGGQTPMAGSITSMIDRLHVDETITFYLKYLNALPDGPHECTLTARWNNRPEGDGRLLDSVKGKLSEKNPYLLLVRLKAGQRGSLSPVQVTEQEQQEFRQQIAAARCEGTACGLDDPGAKPAFVAAIVERFIGKLVLHYLANERLMGGPPDPTERQNGEAVLKVLGESYASKQMKYADVAKWVDILGAPMRARGQNVAPERVREIYVNRLKEAGAPDAVTDMFRFRATSSYYDMNAAVATMQRAGIRRVEIRANRQEDEQNGRQLIDQAIKDGNDPPMVMTVGRMVADGRLKLEPARALLKLVNEYRTQPQRDFSSSPAAAELQALLPQVVRDSRLTSALSVRTGRVPPELSLPLIRQIEPY